MVYVVGTFAVICALAWIHIYAGRLSFLDTKPHSPWLSLSAGTALAYVFVYLLPKLASLQVSMSNAYGGAIYEFLRYHVYLVALAGFLLFYGINWASDFGRADADKRIRLEYIFYVETAGFALYNLLIGYLIGDIREPSAIQLVLVVVILGLHFAGLDHGLRHRYANAYDRVIRWWLAAALIGGWTIAILTKVSDTTLALWAAFVGGAIIISVIREELPSNTQSRLAPFLVGAVGGSLLILLLETFPNLAD